MGDVGIDIKDALVEVGTRAQYVSGEETQIEYIKLKLNSQATKPFIREHFLDAMLPYDSSMVVGDIVALPNQDNISFLVVNKTPEGFEDNIIRYKAVFYKCNIQDGVILRPSGELWDDQTYLKREGFEIIRTGCKGLISAPLFGNDLDESPAFAQISLKKQELYFPTSYGVRVKDRIQTYSGEYYLATTVIHSRYPGVDVIELEEDTR